MRLVVNGQEHEVDVASTVDAVLAKLGIRAESVAVAVNLECIRRSAFATTPLREGDEVEILSPHQGG